MKRIFLILSLPVLIMATACGSEQEGHSHGPDADHTHEPQPTQTAPADTQATGEEPQEESGHTHGPDADHTHEEDTTSGDRSDAAAPQREGSGVVTQWTEDTELFMEYPELIVGEEATFAVHLTRLSDFRPLSNSEVQFVLRSSTGAEISVMETEVQVAGIYGPDFTFEEAGRYDLTIRIQGMVDDTLQVRGIPVYNSASEIPQTAEAADPNLITFLKEQQWNIPFGTHTVGTRTLSRTVDAHGEIVASRNGQAVVSAPFSGILLPGNNPRLPVEGQQVESGDALAVLNPAIQSDGGDNYVQQFINARSELELAESRLDRSRRLYDREAIPETELQQARVSYRQALTRYRTIQQVMNVDSTSVEGLGGDSGSYRFELKSPIQGTIVESMVTPGMQVSAGQPLYRIADPSRVWLQARVPAARYDEIATPLDAAYRIQGSRELTPIASVNGRLVSHGRQVNPDGRTVSLTYEISNENGRIPLGMYATVHIGTEQRSEVLAVPESALIEEEGTYYVYVHVGGESFQKREVNLGITDRGWVEVTSGLTQGEHVVTTNAYRVKLASLSSEAPAHGHTH